MIELRSEKVRNIIGKVPSVLFRYGIFIISISIFIVLFLLYTISIPRYISVPIKLHSIPHIMTTKSENSGIIRLEYSTNHKAFKGQYLMSIESPNKKEKIYSNESGYCFYNCKDYEFVEKNSILNVIIPDSILELYGIGFISAHEKDVLKEGMPISIKIGPENLVGNIKKIYPIQDNKEYKVEFLFQNYKDFVKFDFLLQEEYIANILISNKPILVFPSSIDSY